MTPLAAVRRRAASATLLLLVAGCAREPLAPKGAITLVAVAGATTQTTPVGTAVPVRPSVLALDADGRPVAGVRISFVVTSGNGVVNWDQSALTDETGRSTVFYWTVGMVPGPNALTAVPTNSTSNTQVVFSATGTP